MKTVAKEDLSDVNVIPELVTDEIYALLIEHRLLNPTKVRNYLIKRRYKQLREQKLPVEDCVETIWKDYPYLTYESIWKISVRKL